MPFFLDPSYWHNCSGLESHDAGGWLMPRFPAAVRARIHGNAQWRSLEATGVELRFVSDAPRVWVTVSALGGGGEVLVHRGDIHQQKVQLLPSTPVTLVLEPPNFGILRADTPLRRRFSPDVWRLEFGRGVMKIHSVDVFGGGVRPPRADEVPARRWLAHGSSITHSSPTGYPAQAARLLGVDVLNKGLAGSCHAEHPIAEHLAEQEQWDFATVELGVNMRGRFSPEQFGESAGAFLDLLADRRSDAALGVITHFTNAQHFPADPDTVAAAHQRAYDTFLRDWVARRNDPRLRLLEGTEILDDFSLLSADLIHPTLEGQTRMAQRLADMLQH